MKTYYSILYFNIRPEIDERLSIGLLMVFGTKVGFRYSKQKLNAAKGLISTPVFKAAINYLKYIDRSVDSYKKVNTPGGGMDLSVENKYHKLFSESYLEYLSRYNNNFLSFTKPKVFDLEFTDEVFRTLFTKLIDDDYTTGRAEKPEKEIVRFKKIYYPKVRSYYSIEETIDSTNFSGLLTPIKLDLLGKNEQEVFGQSVDFDNQVSFLEHSISKLMHLHYALPDAKQFIIGTEPEKQKEINHRIWENARSHNVLEYIDLSEADKIEQYAKEHGVKPLFSDDN